MDLYDNKKAQALVAQLKEIKTVRSKVDREFTIRVKVTGEITDKLTGLGIGNDNLLLCINAYAGGIDVKVECDDPSVPIDKFELDIKEALVSNNDFLPDPYPTVVDRLDEIRFKEAIYELAEEVNGDPDHLADELLNMAWGG